MPANFQSHSSSRTYPTPRRGGGGVLMVAAAVIVASIAGFAGLLYYLLFHVK